MTVEVSLKEIDSCSATIKRETKKSKCLKLRSSWTTGTAAKMLTATAADPVEK